MATAAFETSAFNMASFNQCVDPDVDSWVDYGAMPSPPSASSSRMPSTSTTTSPTTTILQIDSQEDHQTPAKPSHEYERWKQQTGLPTGSVPGLHPSSSSSSFTFSNSGLAFDDMGLMGDSSALDAGWNSGLGMGADVNMELDLTSPGSALPAFFSPTGNSSQSESFVNPSAISPEETKPNVRFWPGMHQQQAAIAKAQQQAQQQRQQQMLQQQQQQKQSATLQPYRPAHSRRPGSNQITDARTEETIARVVNQIRQNSALASNDGSTPPANLLPHIVKMKKDEEDMDEDERLLASEEGKKLSSKERRQLRNKVSARAFRSRRKEYIGQLEGEVALKTNDANELRDQNHALMEENARYRAFTEKLLRHPAFQPFLEDLSRDPALNESLAAPPMPTTLPSVPSQSSAPAPQHKDMNPYQQHSENLHIGMATIPETQVDLSMNNWNMPSMNGFNFQQPQVYSVLELPQGPAQPIDTDVLSGKGCGSLSEPEPVEEVKPDFPVVERPAAEATSTEETSEADEEDFDPDFALFYNSSAPASSPAAFDEFEPIFGHIAPEKAFAHIELFVSEERDDTESQRLMERFERQTARMEVVFQRMQAMTSCLDI